VDDVDGVDTVDRANDEAPVHNVHHAHSVHQDDGAPCLVATVNVPADGVKSAQEPGKPVEQIEAAKAQSPVAPIERQSWKPPPPSFAGSASRPQEITPSDDEERDEDDDKPAEPLAELARPRSSASSKPARPEPEAPREAERPAAAASSKPARPEPEAPREAERPVAAASSKPARPEPETRRETIEELVARAQRAADIAVRAAADAADAVTLEERRQHAQEAARAAAEAREAAEAARHAVAEPPPPAVDAVQPPLRVEAPTDEPVAAAPVQLAVDLSAHDTFRELPPSERTAELDASEIEFVVPPPAPRVPVAAPAPTGSEDDVPPPPPPGRTVRADLAPRDWRARDGLDLDDDVPARGGRIARNILIVALVVLVPFGIYMAARSGCSFGRGAEGTGAHPEMEVAVSATRVVQLETGERMVWVRATAKNNGVAPRRNVTVKATMFDSRHEKVGEAEARCGLAFTLVQLEGTTRAELESQLGAISESDSTVAPRSTIPCTVMLTRGAIVYQPALHTIEVVVTRADGAGAGGS
jgi:hypothetical protein